MTPTTAQDAEALAAPQAPAHRRRRHLLSGSLLVLTLGALTLLAAWQAASMSERIARDAIAATATERARLYESSIHGALTRFDYIPDMVARYPRVRALLTRTGAARPVNVLLEELAQRSGADVLYVLDRTGMTVASSNWRDAFSFVGKNYGFRPYFRDALAGGRGRFFAVGVTTGRAGLFFSEAVRVDGEIVGVSVVKLETRTLQNDWRAGGENVLVTDADGVVILASRDDWALPHARPAAARRARAHRGKPEVFRQAVAPARHGPAGPGTMSRLRLTASPISSPPWRAGRTAGPSTTPRPCRRRATAPSPPARW